MTEPAPATWKLWLDDIRDPFFYLRRDKDGHPREPKFRFYLDMGLTQDDVVWCKNHQEAIAEVQKRGVPEFMALDHDLGPQSDTMQFLKWLSQEHPDSPPKWFSHSGNTVGVQNMDSYMDSWHRSLAPCFSGEDIAAMRAFLGEDEDDDGDE